jgi:predicted amidohydrolase YtcJ
MAVRGNRVLGTGSNDDMMALAGSGAEVVDLDGLTVLPGFIEPHMHLSTFFFELAGFTASTSDRPDAYLRYQDQRDRGGRKPGVHRLRNFF